MPEPFTHTNAVADRRTIWLVGGYVGDTPGPGTTHVWKYDTSADAWSRGPDLPEPRGSGGAAVIGRELHYFGGRGKGRIEDRADHWVLDLDHPDAGWARRAQMPRPRNHMAAAAVGGMIYAVGGQVGEQDAAAASAEVDAYDPAADAWTRVADLPGPRSHQNASTFALGGRLIVAGGESELGVYHDDLFAYDPAANVWSTLGHLPAPRGTPVAAVIDEQLIVSTGNGPGETDTTWLGELG